jgi:predicted thioredoxin/glutaredoxin
MRWKGLLKLRRNLGDAAIDYVQAGGYDIFNTAEKERAEVCISKINYFNNITKTITGIPDIFSVGNSKIEQFGFNNISSIIKNKSEGQIDTGKMMRALISKAQSFGLKLLKEILHPARLL